MSEIQNEIKKLQEDISKTSSIFEVGVQTVAVCIYIQKVLSILDKIVVEIDCVKEAESKFVSFTCRVDGTSL